MSGNASPSAHRVSGDITASASCGADTRPFPATERIIIEWRSIFREGQTFPNYDGYVKKACYFPKHPTSWETQDAANVIAALKLLSKGRFCYPNFVRSNANDQLRERENPATEPSPVGLLSPSFSRYGCRRRRYPSGAPIVTTILSVSPQ